MCFRLGPILTNNFVRFFKRIIFDGFPKPYIYLRYVDDTFAFSSRNEALLVFHCLNDLHPSLTFTMEEVKDNKLVFWDMLVELCSSVFLTRT